MTVTFDLHNHSALSPCADNDLTPGLLAVQAMELGIDILGLCDHNSARNLPAFKEACELCGILPVFGLEVTTSEDIHVLALFEYLDDALTFGTFVEYLLPAGPKKRSWMEDQLIFDADGELAGMFEKPLFGTSGMSFSDVVEEVLSRDGLVIPAHIDRPSQSVLANLGFLPDLPYSALEVLHYPPATNTRGHTLIQSSDAHSFEMIGKRTCKAEFSSRDFQGLKQALLNNSILHEADYISTVKSH